MPLEELTTEPSVVVHAKSGRKLSYGEIAAFAEVPDKAPEVKPDALKKPGEFRLIGKDVGRVELPGKVNGSARYSHRRAGARTCSTAPCCAHRSKARCRTRSTTPRPRLIAGAVTIVRLPYGVGVLAETPWAAFEARRALTQSVTWSRTGTAWGFDSEKGMERFAADAKNPARPAQPIGARVGDAARRDAEGCQHASKPNIAATTPITRRWSR